MGSLEGGLIFAGLDPLGTFRHLKKFDSQARDPSFLNPQAAGNQIGHVQFAVIHEWAAVIYSHQLADVGFGVVNANQGAEWEGGAGSCGPVHVKFFAAGSLPAVEPGAVPACPTGPNSNWLNRLAGMGYQGSLEALRHHEHQWQPADCGPDHEESSAHRFPKGPRQSNITTWRRVIQALSAWSVPIKSLILWMLYARQAFSKQPTNVSQAAGSAKLAVPT
jgi:hypothetical protein